MHTPVFKTALVTVATQCDKPRPTAHGEIKRWWNHMMDYYSAIKRDNILACATVYWILRALC